MGEPIQIIHHHANQTKSGSLLIVTTMPEVSYSSINPHAVRDGAKHLYSSEFGFALEFVYTYYEL